MKTSVLRKRRKSSSPTRRRVRDGQPHDPGRRRREDRARPRSKTRPAGRRLLSVLDEVYKRSLEEPEAFWADAAAAIDWDEPWERVLGDSRAPFYRWFAGGVEHITFHLTYRPPARGRGLHAMTINHTP